MIKKEILPAASLGIQFTPQFPLGDLKDAVAEELHKCLNWGYQYNQIQTRLYERVWTLGIERDKASPFNEPILQPLISADLSHAGVPRVAAVVKKLGRAADAVLDCLALSSVQSGCFFTTTLDDRRPRLPVHTHKNVRSPSDDTGWTASFYFRLGARSKPQEFYFYDSPDDEMTGLDFEIRPDISIELDRNFGLFIFRADLIPHTVVFTEDVYLWHVTNCIVLNEGVLLDKTSVYEVRFP